MIEHVKNILLVLLSIFKIMYIYSKNVFKNAGHENKNAILAHNNEQESTKYFQFMVLIRFWLLVQGMKTKFKTKLKLKI